MKNLFLICLLSFPILAFAQIDSAGLKNKIVEPALYKNAIKLSLLNFADPIIPNAEISFERKIAPKYSVQLGGAYIFKTDRQYDLSGNSVFANNYRNAKYKAKIELRRFDLLKLKHQTTRLHYFALEFSYLHNYYYSAAFLFPPDNLLKGDIDTILVKKQVLSLNFKSGHEIIYKNFMIDFFYGLGLRYINVLYDEKNKAKENWLGFGFMDLEGKKIKMNILLNLRIGYCF